MQYLEIIRIVDIIQGGCSFCSYMFMGSHQVVSKHSILGAPMDTRHKGMEPETEELERCLEGMSVMLREIERLLKRRKREKSRHRTRRHRASSRRSRGRAESNTVLKINDEPVKVEEEIEENLVDLKAQNSEGIGKPVTHGEGDVFRRNGGNLFVPVKPETGEENCVVEAKTHFAEVESEKNICGSARVFHEKQVATNVVGLFPPISDMLSHVSQRDFHTGQHISVDSFQVSLTSLIADAFLSPTYLEVMRANGVTEDISEISPWGQGEFGRGRGGARQLE